MKSKIELRAAFLSVLEKGLGETFAAKEVGMTPSEYAALIDTDKEFCVACEMAKRNGLFKVRDEAVVIMRKCATGEIASSVKLQAAQRLLDYAERELSARRHDTNADTSEHDFESEWAQKLSSRKQIEKT
jgi:hypothetical protein